jgi:hypothetical protein
MVSQTDALAYSGGALLACCLVPQLHLMWVNQSAHDVSISWTLFYITGLLQTLVYLVEVNAFAGWISVIPEIALALCVLASKLFLDRKNGSKDNIVKAVKDDASSHNAIQSETLSQRCHVIMDFSNVFSHGESDNDWIVDVMQNCLINNGIQMIQKNTITNIESRITSVFFLNDGYININHCISLGTLDIIISICSINRIDILKVFYEQVQSNITTKFPDCVHKINHIKLENSSSQKISQIIETVSQNDDDNNIEKKDPCDSV